MPQQHPCLLLDANAIFEAYRYGVWQAVLDAYRVVIPSSVVRDEAQFYITRDDCRRKEIDLPELVQSGDVIEWVASAAQIAAVRARFNQVFVQGLDAGETEALTSTPSRSLSSVWMMATGGSSLGKVSRSESPSFCLTATHLPRRPSPPSLARAPHIDRDRREPDRPRISLRPTPALRVVDS